MAEAILTFLPPNIVYTIGRMVFGDNAVNSLSEHKYVKLYKYQDAKEESQPVEFNHAVKVQLAQEIMDFINSRNYNYAHLIRLKIIEREVSPAWPSIYSLLRNCTSTQYLRVLILRNDHFDDEEHELNYSSLASAISYMTNLRILNISTHGTFDCSVLQNLPHLVELQLELPTFTNLSKLPTTLISLNLISLHANIDCDDIAHLQLKDLALFIPLDESDRMVYNVGRLPRTITSLCLNNLRDFRLEQLEFILPNLEYLALARMHVTSEDKSCFPRMKKLKYLSIVGVSSLVRVDWIPLYCRTLTSLNLCHTSITSIEPLYKLSTLKFLQLGSSVEIAVNDANFRFDKIHFSVCYEDDCKCINEEACPNGKKIHMSVKTLEFINYMRSLNDIPELQIDPRVAHIDSQ